MTNEAAKELDYGFAMSVQALVTALGMHWKNEELKLQNQLPLYKDEDFKKLIDTCDIGYNDILTRWLGK